MNNLRDEQDECKARWERQRARQQAWHKPLFIKRTAYNIETEKTAVELAQLNAKDAWKAKKERLTNERSTANNA